MKVHDNISHWVSLLTALELVNTSSDEERIAEFRKHFRVELPILCNWLDNLKITGGQPHISYGPPSNCDLCEKPFLKDGLFVDGQMKDGTWANVCMDCFKAQGSGIGYGVGQLYKKKGLHTDGEPLWVCIAGGDPRPPELTDEVFY